jgi:hypothetical protein
MTTPSTPSSGRSSRGSTVIHEDLSQIGGRVRLSIALWVVLFLAGATDVATFHQVMALVIDATDGLVWLITMGFTVVALWLIHLAGINARRSSSGRNPHWSTQIALGTFAVWLLLGILAFAVRYTVDPNFISSGDDIQTTGADVTNAAATASDPHRHLAAFMFLALYIGTGIIAGAAGFLAPNPAARQYNRTLARRGRASRKAAESGAWVARLVRTTESVDQARRRIADMAEHRHQDGADAGGQLKQEIRLQLRKEGHR